MTLILKSDVKSSNSIGNTFGLKGALDFTTLLDFSRGEYLVRRNGDLEKLQLGEVVTVGRSTTGSYTDENGVVSVASANEARIHYDKDKRVYGLLLERSNDNKLANPHSPATQVFAAPSITNKDVKYLLTVKGTGSALASGAITKTGAAAQEGSPQVFTVPRSETVTNVNIEVTGSLEYFDVVADTQDGGSYEVTINPLGVQNRDGDKVVISDNLKAEIRNAKTVIAHFIPHKRTDLVSTPDVSMYSFFMYNRETGLNKSMIEANIKLPSAAGVSTTGARIVSSAASSNSIMSASIVVSSYRSVTQCVSFGSNTADAKLSANGQLFTFTPSGQSSDNADYNIVDLSQRASVGGLLTHLVIYDRELSASELIEITQSWV